jgi:hypothetical protein
LRSRTEHDMDAELRFHLDARTDDLAGSGLSREDAERRARTEFGDMLRWKEHYSIGIAISVCRATGLTCVGSFK